MASALPASYYSLAPFRQIFRTGLPILTYHKLGPRPRGARLKGLYLSEQLFARQLRELRQAGFETSSLDSFADPVRTHASDRIVLTFDDGFSNVLEHGLRPLAENNFRAIQFLVANHLGGRNEWDVSQGEVPAALMDTKQVRDWLAAGQEIGAHSLTHPRLTRLSPGQAREEITASKKKLEDLFGLSIDHFCYPYGDWNEPVRDLVAAAGYKTACTTQPGINLPGDSPFGLKRFTARYRSRNLKSLWNALAQRFLPMKA